MGSSSSHSRPVVSERDAWDIARAWRDQLQGCVRLETTTEHIPTSIIPTFEWVVFVLNGTLHQGFRQVTDVQQTAAYARAATIAWFALSCCQGYSGAENPQFWRRVFYELLYPKRLPIVSKRATYPARPQIPITDAVRFFSHSDKPFPRVKLVVGEYDEDATIESVFLGRQPCTDQTRDTKLLRILTKLQSFIRVSDGMRRVPVEIDFLTPPTTKPATHLRNEPSGGEMEPVAVVSVSSLMNFPQLYLQSVVLQDTLGLSIHSLHSLISPSDVEVWLGGDVRNFVDDHQLCCGLLDQLQANATEDDRCRWRVTRLLVERHSDLSTSYVSVVCSALPHLRSIQTVTTRDRRYYSQGTPSSSASDWAWMGYAIFHPDTASLSGFATMDVGLDGISEADIAALAKMAGGNNLRGGRNTGYFEGRVRCGTAVKTHPVNDGEANLHTVTREAWVSICVNVNLNALQHDAWVCVVVPGFGSGWVREDDIVETRCRPPGESCVRVLRVNAYSKNTSEEALLGLLGVLGDRLTSLHFQFSKDVSASTVHAIMRLCPALKSLRIHHDGSFWAHEAWAMALPKLEELELSVKTCSGYPLPLQALKPACLPFLKALRVISVAGYSYKQHEQMLVAFLSNQPVLQYLHWSRGFDLLGAWVDTPSNRKNDAPRKLLSQFSHGPLRANCRLAFLSVMRGKTGQSSVCRLGEDVVTLIFRYATSPVLREICINP